MNNLHVKQSPYELTRVHCPDKPMHDGDSITVAIKQVFQDRKSSVVAILAQQVLCFSLILFFLCQPIHAHLQHAEIGLDRQNLPNYVSRKLVKVRKYSKHTFCYFVFPQVKGQNLKFRILMQRAPPMFTTCISKDLQLYKS